MAIDEYTSITSPDPRSGLLTAEQLQARRAIAAALATRSRPYPKTIGEGLTAFGEGLGEGIYNRDVARAEAAQIAHDAALMRPPSGAVTPAAPSVTPAVPRAPAGRTSMEGDPTQSFAMVPPDAAAEAQPSSVVEQAPQQPQMPVEEWKQRTARSFHGINEKDPYRYIGPANDQGDHGYGKYRVMGASIAPWTEQYLGVKMTPREFLGSEKAQEALASARGSDLMSKYGPDGAAAAWFVGENNMNGDPARPNLKLHVDEYVKRFNIPLADRDQITASAAGGERPIQVASLGGMPTPDTAPDPTRDAVAQTVLAQQGVQSPSQQVAQAQPLPSQTPTQQMPIGPRVPDYPAYGPKPTPPQPTPDMIQYYRASLDPYASAGTRAGAKMTYDQMKADQDAKYARDYKFWEENYLRETTHKTTLPKQQEDLTNAYLERLGKPQKIITGEAGAAAAQAAPPVAGTAQSADPYIGTSQSQQRTGIPKPPPKPAGQSEEEWSKLQGTLMSKAIEAIDKAVPAFNDAIKTIQLARQHPGSEYGVGTGASVFHQMPWTDAAGFGKIMQQIQGKNFLSGYEHLKGGGSITEIEGKKTEQAQARVATDQKKEDWAAAMNDLEIQLRRDMELAQRKVNMPVTAWRPAGDNSSYAPDIGQTKGDHKYIGGDPSNPMSWQKFR